jgi:hypothetical protein
MTSIHPEPGNRNQRVDASRHATRLAAAVCVALISLAVVVPSTQAAGPIYTVPPNPPSGANSVKFTNALNRPLARVPPSLSPATDSLSPAQLAARTKVLDRGVVVSRRPRRATKSRAAGDRRTAWQPAPGGLPITGSAPGREPLLFAFVAAGIMALVGFLLSARRWRRSAASG